MKFIKLNNANKLIAVSVLFTIMILAFRVWYTKELNYCFYPWNLFLAIVPLFFSGYLKKQRRINFKTILMLCGWLFFLPNAPYLLTDIFHFDERPPVPAWFDLILVISGAWNGVLICMISLFQVEKFIQRNSNSTFSTIIMIVLLFPCGYGVYLGRYLRYNTWDIVTDPFDLVKASTHHIHHPFQNLNVWLFTVLFAMFLNIIYFTIKKLPGTLSAAQ